MRSFGGSFFFLLAGGSIKLYSSVGKGGKVCTRISDSEASLTDYMHTHDMPQRLASHPPSQGRPAQSPSTRLCLAALAYPRPAARSAQTPLLPPTTQRPPAWSMSPGIAGPARTRANATGISEARDGWECLARPAPPARTGAMRSCKRRKTDMRFSARGPACGVA